MDPLFRYEGSNWYLLFLSSYSVNITDPNNHAALMSHLDSMQKRYKFFKIFGVLDHPTHYDWRVYLFRTRPIQAWAIYV